MANYDLLKTIIFDQEVVNYTTIIRTCFTDFEDKEKCQDDVQLMIAQGGKLQEIIDSFQKNNKEYRIIHVDNPSLKILPDDKEKNAVGGEKEQRKTKRENKIEKNKGARSLSRKILVEHLGWICQEKLYQPSKLKELSANIADDYFQYLKKKEELQKELDQLKFTRTNIQTLKTRENTTISLEGGREEAIIEQQEEYFEDVPAPITEENELAIGEIIKQ